MCISRLDLLTYTETIKLRPDCKATLYFLFLAPCHYVLTVIYIQRNQADMFMDLSYHIMNPIRVNSSYLNT